MNKIIITFITLIISLQAVSNTLEESMVYPGEFIDGKPLVEFANIWWQWTYTMPQEVSPVRDITGANCHQGQRGDVWFLAGGYGSSTIKRKCEIPLGKHIFFPVINMLYYPSRNSSLTCSAAKKSAALNNDKLLTITIELDGMHASNPAHSRLTPEGCFDLLGLVSRDLNPPKIYPSASDGYWIMLKPLTKGTHILKFQAKYNRDKGAYSKMAQDIEYELIIK